MLAIRPVLTSCVLCCALGSAAPAAAEPHDKKPLVKTSASEAKPDLGEPEAVAKERARMLFDKGVSAYREGRFYDAVDIFLETNRLYPDPKLSFNVAKAFEGLGNQAGALRYYREYLRRLPDAPDAKDVSTHIHQLEQALSQKGLQQLTVISTPDGATLKLDGQAVGVTPWTGESFAGKHRVVLEALGYQPSERVIELDLHRASDFGFELSRVRRLRLRSRERPHAQSRRSACSRWARSRAAWRLLGTALVAQAASGDSKGVTRTAAFFAGSGAGVSVLGGVMLYFDFNPSPHSSGVTWGGAGLEHGSSR